MPDRTPLDAAAIAVALAAPDLAGWTLDDERLTKTYTFPDFRTAVAFVVRVAFEAEALDHHPELANVYDRVSVALTTHDAENRVTETDLELARRMEAVAAPFLAA